MKQKIIGLAGPAGVGKDTVAMRLRLKYGYKSYAFAKPLKEALAVLGLKEPTSREVKEALIPGRSFSYRKAAQTLGTEWARSLEKSFWLTLAEQNLQGLAKVAITDVRFEDEAAWIRSSGGVIWRITGRESTVSGQEKLHLSEAGLADNAADKTIDNSKDFDYLHEQIAQLMLNSIF